MSSYETDYVWKAENEVPTRSRWSPSYLQKFTSLLRDNTVLLQRVQGYPRDDPVHELKRRALEEARVKLHLANVDQVRARITTFRQFATGKFRTCAARCGPGSSLDTILRCMPKWLRELEPHLNLWKMREQKSDGPVSLSSPDEPGGRLASALAARAKTRRTLEAGVVASGVGGVHINKHDELKFIWWRMLDVVRQKLSLLCAGGGQGQGAVKLTGTEPLLAELLLLYDESINTLPNADDTEGVQALVGLFHVAQQFNLEDEPSAGTWRRAHTAYITEHHKVIGFRGSRLLMQRRWYELKLATRLALIRYARDPTFPTSPLHASIAKRFPHVVTAPWPSWRDVVNFYGFVEAHQEWTSQEAETDSMPSCEYKPLEVAAHCPEREREGDGEDDIIVVEKEIETIDLDLELGSETQDLAAELEKDLDRQLAQLHPTEPSEGVLFTTEPSGPPTFIYDSDDDMDDDDDREKSMSVIATQICSEINDHVTCDDDDDEHGTIDEKLLMDARVQLRRIDASAQWRSVAEGGTINIRDLLHTSPPCKRVRTIDTDLTEMKHYKRETPSVVVKQEKIDDDPSTTSTSSGGGGRGERQMKSMARLLIAEMMRDTDNEPTTIKNVAKKVQLSDIEQVRKNNSTMLTAQVAPLTTPTPTPTPTPTHSDTHLLTTDAVLESARAHTEDTSLTKQQLDLLLEQLTLQRQTSNITKYCCPAREQHLSPSVTKRVGSERYTCRSCSQAGDRCKCCCWYLVRRAHSHSQHNQTRAQLLVEQTSLATDLNNLATDDTTSVLSEKAKKRPNREKKQGVTLPVAPSSDPLEEWIRQKNLNQQYFNLNLKTPNKPTAPTKTTTCTPPLSTAPTKTTLSSSSLLLSTATSTTTYRPSITTNTIHMDDRTQPSTTKYLTIVPLTRSSTGDHQVTTAPAPGPAPAPPPTHSNILSIASATALTQTQKSAPAPPAPPEFRKYIIVSAKNGDSPVKTKVVFANNNPRLKTSQRVGVEGAPKIINFDPSMSKVEPSRGPLASDPSLIDLTADKPKVHTKLKSTLKSNIVIKGISQKANNVYRTNGQKTVKLVMAPSRTIPGNTLVRLCPAPSLLNSSLTPVTAAPPRLAPAPAPAGEVKVTPTTVPSYTYGGVKLAPKPSPSATDSGAVMSSVQSNLRGTGMEVTKISAAGPGGTTTGPDARSEGGHTRPSGPDARSKGAGKSLLKDTSASSKIDVPTKSGMNKQLVKMNVHQKTILSNDQRSVINLSTDHTVKKLTRLSDGAVLTKLATGNKWTVDLTDAGTGNSSSSEADIQIQNYFKHDETITIFGFLSRVGSMLALQVIDEGVPPLMIGARYHLVTERPLHARRPQYWTVTPPLCRLVADSCVLFPPLELVDNTHQLQLQDSPTIYAKVYWVIQTVSQCVSELSSGASLFVTSQEGSLTPLTREEGHNLIKCQNEHAAKVLTDLLSASNSSKADSKSSKADTNNRADINARASALLALNHRKRRPLELVHVSDDESEEQKHVPKQTLHYKFNGLERFEDMDDFEL